MIIDEEYLRNKYFEIKQKVESVRFTDDYIEKDVAGYLGQMELIQELIEELTEE